MIQDLQQLRGIDRNLGGSYALGNRIAGGHSSFLSIGNASAFGGTFDGLGNTIDNLAVYGTGAYSGLFSVNRGTLRNLNLERISADGAQATHYNVQVGSLAAVNLGRIDNVNASDIRIAAASQLNSLGGLVALNLGSIDNASAAARWSATATPMLWADSQPKTSAQPGAWPASPTAGPILPSPAS